MSKSLRLADWQVTAVVAAVAVAGAFIAPLPAGARALAVAHGVAQALPLAVRRTRPLAALGTSTLIVAGGALAGLGNVGSEFAPIAAAYAAGAYGRAGHALWVGLSAAVLALSQAGVVVGGGRDAPTVLEVLVPVGAVTAAAFLAGRTVRARRELAAQRTRQAVRDERAHIARELHDVVAHHVGAMVVQAGAARRVLERRPESALEALADIERAGREALDAMPAILGALRDEQQGEGRDPAGSLDRLEELVARSRSLGLTVHVTTHGEPRPVPPGVDLSAYRVVQEALTNALKHAGPARVDITLRYDDTELVVLIQDDGTGPADGFAGRGRGLLGMRERVSLLGGTLEAGAADGGGFRVRAGFPLPRSRKGSA